MSSLSHPGPSLSTVAEDDSYTQFSDYAESEPVSEHGVTSDTTQTTRDFASWPLLPRDHLPDNPIDTQAPPTAAFEAQGSQVPLPLRPFSEVPLREPPTVDAKHRAAYSLDSSRPRLSKRETSWYLEDLEEENIALPPADS